MKTLALLLVVVGVALAEHGHAPKYHEPHHDYHPVHYQYGYKVNDDYHKTKFGHNEKRDGKHTSGEYYVHLPDGRVQTVKYSVDGYGGYVADVSYSDYHAPHHPAPAPYHPPPPPPPPHKGYGGYPHH